jgi:hypothetical protein
MTSNRNIALDLAATAALLDADLEIQLSRSAERPNWLGHGRMSNQSKGADVDAALLIGATDVQLDALRPSWRAHVHHLRERHEIFVIYQSGLYRFAHVDPLDETEVGAVSESTAEYLDDRNIPQKTNPRRRQDDTGAPHCRFYGFVVQPAHTGNPVAAVVHSNSTGALGLLNESAARTIFVITGSDETAVLAATATVAQVWNQWVKGQPAAIKMPD